jgi:mRNA-degrading endonuclease toxin of MazEF toxin-antitoxin module
MPSQGDIVLIPIPFTDLSSRKRRPVIVISNDEYNRTAPDVVRTVPGRLSVPCIKSATVGAGRGIRGHRDQRSHSRPHSRGPGRVDGGEAVNAMATYSGKEMRRR